MSVLARFKGGVYEPGTTVKYQDLRLEVTKVSLYLYDIACNNLRLTHTLLANLTLSLLFSQEFEEYYRIVGEDLDDEYFEAMMAQVFPF